MKRQFVLTVAESKRLIAKGVAALPEVQQAMTERTVVVTKTTTNAYVLEELWGKKIDKRAYRIGVTTPKEPDKDPKPQPENIPDKIFIKRDRSSHDILHHNFYIIFCGIFLHKSRKIIT